MVDVKTFCDSAGTDLINWKAKLYDAIRKTQTMKKVDQVEIEPLVTELNQLMDDLDKHIKILAEECPLEWDIQKTEIQDKLSRLNAKYNDLDGAMDVWNMNLETSR